MQNSQEVLPITKTVPEENTVAVYLTLEEIGSVLPETAKLYGGGSSEMYIYTIHRKLRESRDKLILDHRRAQILQNNKG